MRTTEARQRAAGFQQLQRAQMNLLVAAQRIRHGRPIACERRRIENYEVEARDDAFVRFDGGVVLEPVENIYRIEGTFVGEAVGGGVAFGGFNRVGTLVEQMNMRRPCPCRVQTEPAQKAEAVKHLSAFRELRHGLIIHLLVQIHSRLVTADQIRFKFQSVQVHGHMTAQFAEQHAVRFRKPFKLARRHITAFHDDAR